MAEIVGENAWVEAIQAASQSAKELEARVEVVELYKQAISEELCSLRLWLGYCQWIWSLHTDSQSADAGWAEEEQLLGQELFGKETALAVWQQGAQATKFRLSDSHELWNKWITIELNELGDAASEEDVARVRELFEERLQVPHSTWDETFQMFSTFITKYDEMNYEGTMVQATRLAKSAKEQYALREVYEQNIQKAVLAKDEGAEWLAWKTYLEWELAQSKKKGATLDLRIALHERALLRYGTVSAELWEDYADVIHQVAQSNSRELPDDSEDLEESRLLSVLKSATNHCPWSGQLWVRCLLTAESDKLPFSTIEEIKEAAINVQKLDASTGLELVYQVYAAWCGVLRRQSDHLKLLSEDDDLVLKGTRSCVKEVEAMGTRLYGKKKYPGDPSYRLEQALVQCLTDRGLLDEARNLWKKLTASRGTSYEFWQRYYNWEMDLWVSDGKADGESPSAATELLTQAALKKNLDWPEKITQMLIEHCERYENSETIQSKLILVRGVMKAVAKRREREAAQAAAAYVVPQQALAAETETAEAVTPQTSKRKRESEPEDENSTKKLRSDDNAPVDSIELEKESQAQHLKRDRENTSVIVTNLPAEVTQTKVRQYFKEYGHINNLIVKTDEDGLASTALIEFRSTDDVKSAFLRDGKYFGENQIHVAPGTSLTLYVTNYPPTADESYMRDLFKDCGDIFSIRWPSLKFNTHRRFCYISFRTAEAAAAATQLDGKMLEGKYKLEAKYSNPNARKPREGAMNEGRELHISNLDWSASEDEVKEIFSKYGTVESVRILRNIGGRSKGAGFVVFEQKDNATEALALDKTKFKANILNVELSSATNFKPKATSTLQKSSSASPAPHNDGDVSMSPAPDFEDTSANTQTSHGPTRSEIAARTMALLNVPDTVNDARIRALAEKYGTIVKLVLRPDHQGAIIEYDDVGAVGKASLGLEGYEIAPGRKLHTGGVKELFKEKDEIRTDKIQIGAASKKSTSGFIQPSAPVRRPAPPKRGGKRGLGFVGAISNNSKPLPPVEEDKGKEAPQKKSNADFAAMYRNTKST